MLLIVKMEILALSIPCVGHSFGLFLLLKTKFPGFNGFFQNLFFINLCLSEVMITSLAIVKRVITSSHTAYYPILIFQYLIAYLLMYEVMILITVERFCAVYFNIKLPLMWSNTKTKILTISLWVFNSAMFVVVLMMELKQKLLDTYMFTILNVIFIMVAIPTYTYIFKKIKQKKKSVASLNKRENTRPSENTRKQFLAVFLLVISFFIFNVIPDFVYFFTGIFAINLPLWTFHFLLFVYCFSYIMDFLIYMFTARPVRRTLRKLVRRSVVNGS